GSELKALRAHPDFGGTVRRDVLAPYLRQGYVPTPCSIYEGFHKLPPAALLSLREFLPGKLPTPRSYWSVREAARAGAADSFRGSPREAAGQLEAVLREVIGQQMVADVPLGAFLSGGVDSSAVVALMQAQSPRPVRTFTIGFHDRAFNEAEYARAVA